MDIFKNMREKLLIKSDYYNIYVTVLCFMLKSIINSFEIGKSLVGVVYH